MKEADAYPPLNFPACRFRMVHRDVQTLIWDELRGRWLVLTPEEWVRRHLIRFLSGHMAIPPVHIAQEYAVKLGRMVQRADAVVVDASGMPLLLAECKAPEVKIDGSVLDQAVRYNSVIGARYLLLTNGLSHYFYRFDGNGYEPLRTLPDLSGYFVTPNR